MTHNVNDDYVGALGLGNSPKDLEIARRPIRCPFGQLKPLIQSPYFLHSA
jgi:hypothetical protein